MTIRHLRIFIAVVENGSMSAAANHLYMTQPSVSQAIQELESHYRGKLFERTHKKLYLTENGKRLLELARQAVGQFDNLELTMARSGARIPLRIGASLTVGTCLMARVIDDLEKELPEIDIFTFVSNTAEIEQKLLRRELDVAVVEGNIDSRDLVCTPVVEDALVLACGRQHEFYQRERVLASELEGQRFAMREKGSGTRKLFEQYLARHHIHIRSSWEANCPQTITNAVICGRILAVMSSRLLNQEAAAGMVKVFQNESGEWNRNFKLVCHKNQQRPPEVEKLLAVLTRCRTLELPLQASSAVLLNEVPS